MQKVIFLGTDLHGKQSEMAAKLVRDLRTEFEKEKIKYKIVSIMNRKEFRKEENTVIIPRITTINKIRKIVQAILLPIILLLLRIRYKKIFCFWTADRRYHSYLFYFLKKIGYSLIFTVISGYDKKYDSLIYCDKIICQSEKMYSNIKKKFSNKSLYTIYPWTDTSIFKPSRKKYDLLIPSVPYKVQDFKERRMEKIIEILKTGKFKSKVIFRSQESYDYFKNSGVRNTELINKILDEKELAEIMSKAKIMPLLYSKGCPDMPLSAIEGMASGCAIITTSETGLSDVINKERCGKVIKNFRNLESALKNLLRIKSMKNSLATSNKYFDRKNNIKKYISLAKEVSQTY